MSRGWFYVCDAGSHWEVRDDEGRRLDGPAYGHVDDAVRAAIGHARRAWREERKPSGVRVQSASGPWHDVTRFGEAGASPG